MTHQKPDQPESRKWIETVALILLTAFVTTAGTHLFDGFSQGSSIRSLETSSKSMAADISALKSGQYTKYEHELFVKQYDSDLKGIARASKTLSDQFDEHYSQLNARLVRIEEKVDRHIMFDPRTRTIPDGTAGGSKGGNGHGGNGHGGR